MLSALLTGKEDSNPHLSHSRVSRYLLCPEQYRLYYLEKLRPKVPSASLVFGQVVHQCIAGMLLKQADPVKSFRETWNVLNGIRLDYSQRESWEKLRVSGEGLLAKFVREERPKLNHIHTAEKPFEFCITGFDIPFVGVIDLKAEVEGKTTVVDFKTSASSFSPDEVALSDQLTAYNLAEPATERLALCVLVKTKEPKIEWHFTTRSGKQLTEYLTKAGYVARAIDAGRFYKRPGLWCAWCDYRSLCVGDKKRSEETLVRTE